MPSPSQVNPARAQFRQDLVLHRIHSRIGPDIQPVSPFDDPIANADHMPSIQDKHLIGDLDVGDAILPSPDGRSGR